MGDKQFNVIEVAEVKRINEKLTKREVARMCGVSYNYYINCTTGLNQPSAKMINSLEEYVNTKTIEVYKKVFNLRKQESIHESLDINEGDFIKITEMLKEKSVFAE